MTPSDIEVTAADQRRAAELAEACVHGDGDKVGDLLADLADAGFVRALAVTGVLARNLAATLIAAQGRDNALRVLESTRLDASIADNDAPENRSGR
jgi:hypothetical protein